MSVVEIDVIKNSNLEHKNLKDYAKNLGKNAIGFVIVLMIDFFCIQSLLFVVL